jgi:hypothetical protein
LGTLFEVAKKRKINFYATSAQRWMMQKSVFELNVILLHGKMQIWSALEGSESLSNEQVVFEGERSGDQCADPVDVGTVDDMESQLNW